MLPGQTTALDLPASDETSGLVGWWTFDDASAEDNSGNNNYGTLNGTTLPWAVDGIVPARDGGPSTGFGFDGSTSYVDIPNYSSAGSALTISFWALSGTPTGNWRPMANSHTDFGGFYLILDAGPNITFSVGNGTTRTQVGVSAAIFDSNWHHLVFTYQASGNQIVYVDGVLAVTGVAPAGNIPAGASTLGFGRNNVYAGDYYKGNLDDVRFYNRAIGADEVWALYAAGVSPPTEGEMPALFVSALPAATLGGSAPMFAPLLGPKFSEFKPQLAFPATSISAVLAVTEASDVAAFNGFVGVSGSLATTDTTDTAAFNGDVVVSGTLAVTENTDTAAFNGSVVVSGTLAVTDTPDTAAFNGDVVVSGTLVVTDGTDTAVFNGTVGNVVAGTLAATDIPDTAAFAGSVVVSGSLAVTETPDVAVFAGDVVISATLSTTDTPDVASFSGVVASTITATFAVTEPTDIVFFTDAQLSFGGFTPDRWRRKEHQYNAYRERTSVIAEAAAHMSSLGGHARAASLSSKERSSIASTAAKARWNNQQA